MSRQEQIAQLMSSWEQAGRQLSAEQLCADSPELLDELKNAIARRRAAAIEPTLADDPNASTVARRPTLNLPPTHIGPYHVIETIGEGGKGTVYKAEQREPLRRTVAIKIIKPGFDSRQIIARFESERQALARMDHPNIARVLDAGMTEGYRPYFVMEFVPGVPVTDFCDENHLTIRERLLVFIEICKAIAHAHTKALIHRDIKSRNVLAFMQDGKPAVKVIDVGIAKAMTNERLTEHTFNTSRGEVVGTYDSMSPEQVEGSPDIDTRTDVYSLGVLLYELLSGAKPFDHETLARATDEELKRIVREVEPPKPSEKLTSLGNEATQVATTRKIEARALASELRRELEWIPLMALRKERQRRYESVQQLQEDVERYLCGEALLAGPESKLYRLRKAVIRHRGAVFAAAVIFLVLVAGIAATSWQAIRATRAQKVADANKAVAQEHEAEALQQAARAQAVNRFQLDMLRAADPDKMLGERVTVLDATVAALKRLDDGELKDQPLIEAAVRDTIGDTLRALSRFDQAEPVLRAALDLRRRELPPNHPDIATSLNQLASLLQERRELVESERLFREALAIRKASLPPDHLDVAQSMNNLGDLLRDAGKTEEVQSLYEQALAIRRAKLAPNHKDVAQSLNNLAAVYQSQGRFDQAEPLLREALAIQRRAHPAGHPQIADALVNLGVILEDEGKLDEAESPLREALDIRRRTLPADHKDTAISLAHLAKLLRARDKLPEAITLSQEALDMRRRLFGPNHELVALNMADLGTMYQDQQDYKSAEPLLLEALQILQAQRPLDERNLSITQTNLAQLLVSQNRYSEAEPLLAASLEMRRRVLPAGHSLITSNINDLATVQQKLGKLSQAEALFREALELRLRHLPVDDLLIAQSRNNLGTVLWQQSRHAEAEPLLREALRIRSSKLGAKDSATRRTATTLVAVLFALERSREAEALRAEYRLPPPASRPQS
jgi:serine/threonine protein kinase